MNDASELDVIGVDRVDAGVLIYFSDGKVSLFTREFLFAHRDEDGNALVSETGEPLNTRDPESA